MDRRLRLRRVTDQRLALRTPAAREAAVRAIMADRIATYLLGKGLTPELKVCMVCHLPQDWAAFPPGDTRDGKRSTCRTCFRMQDRARRLVQRTRRQGGP